MADASGSSADKSVQVKLVLLGKFHVPPPASVLYTASSFFDELHMPRSAQNPEIYAYSSFKKEYDAHMLAL